jgi:hypothetical protein
MSSGCFIPLHASTLEREAEYERNTIKESALRIQHRYSVIQGRNLPLGDALKNTVLLAAGLTLSLSAFAQTNSQSNIAVEPMDHTPTFRVTVVSRSVRAVNYKHRSGATKIDFAGTDLMPAANGQAKVESKKGYIEIEVEFGNLQKPTTFGNEYLTYILWAISPEGRAVNLGEVLVGAATTAASST